MAVPPQLRFLGDTQLNRQGTVGTNSELFSII
jgi:hypothetical protein